MIKDTNFQNTRRQIIHKQGESHLHIAPPPRRCKRKDTASADYSQQTELRFMVVALLGAKDEEKKPWGERLN